MSRAFLLLKFLLVGIPLTGSAQMPRPSQDAATLLDRTIARMGGDSALRGIRSLRLDMMTQWARTTFANRPFADLPSYERNVELRDYTTRAWRNTRQFLGGGPATAIVDVVRDTIAVRLMPAAPNAAPAWGPLNLAYVDERRELFAFAPERLVLQLRHDPALRQLADTTIDGAAHARLQATVDGWPATLFVRRSDALPAMVRFHADEIADFGLAPWGRHEVEFWYSGWQRIAPGVLLPRQRDVRRLGVPYKRMTVLAMVANAPAPADSFAISDSLARAYLATEQRPMWQVDLASMGKLVRERFATTPPMLGTPGAVQIGGAWVLMETAQHEGAVGLVTAWLAQVAPGVPVGAGIATIPSPANGGARWFTGKAQPLYVAPGAAPIIRRVTGRAASGTVVTTPRWIRVGSDSLWLEPFTAPDLVGAMAVYSPTLKWLYLPAAGAPTHQVEQAALIARLAARGMAVEWIGSARGLVTAVSPAK
ncbi:MAG: hypothetical protein IPG05_06155 [Gemmatimonadetes bacterium]|nr:hypothetical protein [Gemmatimonadota bacterium]